MKRYTMMNDYGEDISQADPIESDDGEWVRFEDAAASNIAAIAKIKQELECNCGKMLANYFDESKRFALERWICPAHGYKKI